ncbi:MAG: glycosyltransferase family 2 protein [Deltaproteobacteria bacterium]|nr:glycosyltransferase family 2 protein [Deltaproteobacteria bacterium]
MNSLFSEKSGMNLIASSELAVLDVTYIIPVHNEANILADTVKELITSLQQCRCAEIILAENGSRDRSAEIARSLTGQFGNVSVQTLCDLPKGLGHAWHSGIQLALSGKNRSSRPSQRWLVLSAADLPFGFSDLRSFVKRLTRKSSLQLAIGSKAHSESQVKMPWKRKFASRIFRYLRYLILGMRVEDSQGTIFIREELARELCDHVMTRDYFYSTELIWFCEKKRVVLEELPVIYMGERRNSNVKLVGDSWTMIKHLFRLRIRREGTGALKQSDLIDGHSGL